MRTYYQVKTALHLTTLLELEDWREKLELGLINTKVLQYAATNPPILMIERIQISWRLKITKVGKYFAFPTTKLSKLKRKTKI